jgi:transcriptional regulator with XRE-family HTH domain
MTDLEKTTGEKIKALRQKLYKNQKEVADALGISIPAYSKIETDITDINLSRLQQIADLFSVSAASLLPGKDGLEEVNAGNELAKSQIGDLQIQVINLQGKLINAYEEIDSLQEELITNHKF